MDQIALHMAIDGFSIPLRIVLRDRLRSGRINFISEVVHARSATNVSVIRFYLTTFSNFLCELVNTKVGGKEAIRVAAIVIEFVLCALNCDDQGFHDPCKISCRDPLEEQDQFVDVMLSITPFGAEGEIQVECRRIPDNDAVFSVPSRFVNSDDGIESRYEAVEEVPDNLVPVARFGFDARDHGLDAAVCTGQAYRKCSAESALHIPVMIGAKAGNAKRVLLTAKLDSVKRDEANVECLACACEALVPVYHGWGIFEEEPRGKRRRLED